MNMRLFLPLLMLFCSSVAVASDDGIDLSFGEKGVYQSVGQTVDALVEWAKAEYAEHEGEGLFSRYPSDGAVIQAEIDLAQTFKKQAKQAEAAGDIAKARAYLLSAEAAALYAARMPHMLEARIAK